MLSSVQRSGPLASALSRIPSIEQLAGVSPAAAHERFELPPLLLCETERRTSCTQLTSLVAWSNREGTLRSFTMQQECVKGLGT